MLEVRKNLPLSFQATILRGTEAELGHTSKNNDCVGDIWDSAVRKHALAEIDIDVRQELRNKIIPFLSRRQGSCQLGECAENPVFSCAEVLNIDNTSMSGLYWIRIANGSIIQSYCVFDARFSCDTSGNQTDSIWLRVANINMSNITQNCPYNMWLYNPTEIDGMRLCYKRHSGCTSIFFSSLGFPYSRVRGRVVAYQYGEPDAFKPYHRFPSRTIEDIYVDGLSLTYGRIPRHHVWTFAAAEDATQSGYTNCPCTIANASFSGTVPPFIGNDYFCDTGSIEKVKYGSIYLDDPLWDGAGCNSESTCCEWQNPPWFCKKLSEYTNNDLELRVCSDSSADNESTFIQQVEIYIQ